MVGRERELKELNLELQWVIEGKGRTVLISAEAGVGKTRLVTEFLKSVKQENVIKLSGWCLHKAEIPYFPFIEAFSSYYSTLGERSGKEEAEISSWLKEPTKIGFSGKLEYLSPQVLKDQTFIAVAKTIHSMATEKPVILLIEDIHWADSASLALLHYVARTVNYSERVLVLATFRSEELTSDTEGYPHPLVETLALMRREDLFRQINLPSLNPNCVAKMAESMLGGVLQQDLAERLAAESEGNPLFVVESLRMLSERKRLVQKNEMWCLNVDKLDVPSKIHDIVIRRLGCLSYAQRRILDAASVIGDYFQAGLLSAVVEQDSLEVLETLNVIARATSLIFADENIYRFDHARSREIIYESLSQPLKQGYHKKIAETLENTKGKNLPFSELAHHYAQAGNNEKAVKYALEAGRDALLKWSNSEAIKYFEYALKNFPKEQNEVKIAALDGLGDAYAANCMYAESIKTFDELAELESGDAKLRAIRKAMDAAYAKGDMPGLLLEYAKKAEVLGVHDRLEMARIINNRAKAFAWVKDGSDVKPDLADYDTALDAFQEENSLEDVAEALWRGGLLCIVFKERSEEGLARLLRSVAIFKEQGNIRKEIEATLNTGSAFFWLGLFPEAKELYTKALKIGEKLGAFIELAQANAFLGNVYECEGKLDNALTQTLKALELWKKTDANWMQATLYAILIRQYSKLGNLKHADEYFEKMSKLPQVIARKALNTWGITFKGVYYAANAEWKEANQVFYETLKSWNKSPLSGIRVLAIEGYVQALLMQNRFEEAKVQLNEIVKLLQQAEDRFSRANVKVSLMAPRKVKVGEEFEMRLDIVNISRISSQVVKIKQLVNPKLTVIDSPLITFKADNAELINNELKPFEVKTIKLILQPKTIGELTLAPRVTYKNERDENQECELKGLNIKVIGVASIDNQRIKQILTDWEFKNETARQAFCFLTRNFLEDYLKNKLQDQVSGWRTLMDLVNYGGLSKHSIYGRSGKGGAALEELRVRGLIESRLFAGQRGRSGRILKVRIAIGNQEVKLLMRKLELN